MRDTSIIKQLHPDSITGSDISNLRLGRIAERPEVAAEISIVGSQIVECLAELGRHVVLFPGSLADILPVLGNFVVQNEFAENVVCRGGMGQHSGYSEEACEMLHLEEK